MKTKNKSLASAFAALAIVLSAMPSCSRDESSPSPDQSPHRLQLSSSVTARAVDTKWSEGDPIGVYMTDPSSSAIVNGVENKKYLTPDGSGKFVPESEEAYYPALGAKVNITAYYPYSSAVGGMNYPFSVSNQNDPEAIDIMYSNNLRNVGATTDARELVFDHKLSKVIINVLPTGNLVAGDLNGLTLKVKDIPQNAELNIATGEISNIGNNGNVTARTSADGSASEMILIPANCVDKTIGITLSSGLSFSCTLPSTATIEGGRKYTYTIILTSAEAQLQNEGIIDPWEPGEGGEMEATIPSRYAVGDYYPDADNASTAIGVVFLLDSPKDNKSNSGKIVSLKESWGAWGKTWGTYPDMLTEFELGATEIQSTTDGEIGTQQVIALHSEESDFSDKYTAFAWIHSQNGGELGGRWYMPAKDELLALKTWYNNQDVTLADNLFTAAGGTILVSVKRAYWTSTETAYDKAHCVTFHNSNSMSAMKNIQSMSVRAISKF